MMNHTFPVTLSILSVEALATAVLPSYGLPPITDFRFLHFGLNHTYALKVEGGAQYILRVYRAGWRTLADIAYEIDVLNHLHRQGVAVARPLPQQDGAFVHTLSAPEGPRHALLFTYAPGKEPAYETDGELQAFHYGKSVAQLHLAMQDFTSQHARFPLDLDHLLTTPLQSMAPLLAHRADDWRYVQQLADKICTRLADLPLAALEQGFCHGDLYGGNAHLTADQIVTFFDFDCCGWGWRAYDLAVFRWEARSRQQEAARWGPFLRGYQTERPLPELDLQAIAWFVGVRQFWELGLHTANGHDWGFGWMNDRYFEQSAKIPARLGKRSTEPGGQPVAQLFYRREKEKVMDQQPKLLIECVSGYSPHIGVLVSTLARCREKTIRLVQDLTIQQLDYLWDENANTIGALLLHLAGLEVCYQELSFKGANIEHDPALIGKWGVPLALGEPARQQIRGYPIDYYLREFQAAREVTLQQLRHYDDDWLWQEAQFPWAAFTVNHYWMWYHVYEDEINHRGEISWLKSRIPA